MILALKPDDNEAFRQQAFATLCEKYWFPLYAFSRHRGMNSHDAEDAVQSFFLKIANASYFSKADQDKGKLRTFILTGFTRHLKDLRTHASALKRGGGITPVSLDTNQAEEWILKDEAVAIEDAALNFERNWATNLMRISMDELRAQSMGNQPAEDRFSLFCKFLDPTNTTKMELKEVAVKLNMTASACEKAIQRLRHQFRLTIREQIAATLQHPDEITIMEEMRQLQRTLAAR